MRMLRTNFSVVVFPWLCKNCSKHFSRKAVSNGTLRLLLHGFKFSQKLHQLARGFFASRLCSLPSPSHAHSRAALVAGSGTSLQLQSRYPPSSWSTRSTASTSPWAELCFPSSAYAEHEPLAPTRELAQGYWQVGPPKCSSRKTRAGSQASFPGRRQVAAAGYLGLGHATSRPACPRFWLCRS